MSCGYLLVLVLVTELFDTRHGVITSLPLTGTSTQMGVPCGWGVLRGMLCRSCVDFLLVHYAQSTDAL